MADAESRAIAAAPARPGMGRFERYLSLWVALCIVVGIGLGQAWPGLFASIAAANAARRGEQDQARGHD